MDSELSKKEIEQDLYLKKSVIEQIYQNFLNKVAAAAKKQKQKNG